MKYADKFCFPPTPLRTTVKCGGYVGILPKSSKLTVQILYMTAFLKRLDYPLPFPGIFFYHPSFSHARTF